MSRGWYLLALPLTLVASFLVIIGFSEPGKAQKLAQSIGARRSETPARESMRVIVSPYGPTQESIDAARVSTVGRPEVQRLLKGTNNRLLHFELIESDSKNASQNPPNRFLATFYDYTNNRTVRAEGSYAVPWTAPSQRRPRPGAGPGTDPMVEGVGSRKKPIKTWKFRAADTVAGFRHRQSA
jgi:hypothetical protein